jgi:putative DNA primase/helicase
VASRLECALHFAAAGIAVFPCHTPIIEPRGVVRCTCGRSDCTDIGKHPRTTGGLKDATTDETQIERWWKRWPDANPAGRTGPFGLELYAVPRFLLVLDVDGFKGKITMKKRKLPRTYAVLTGSGRSRHSYFNSAVPLPTSSGKIGPGVDTRGGGGPFGCGYIILPGSLHRSGRTYRRIPEYTREFRDPPEWLVDALLRTPAPNPVAVGMAPVAHGPIQPGERLPDGQGSGKGRNYRLFCHGRSLWAQEVCAEDIHSTLKLINREQCDPPLPAWRIEHLVRRVTKVPAGRSEAYRKQA